MNDNYYSGRTARLGITQTLWKAVFTCHLSHCYSHNLIYRHDRCKNCWSVSWEYHTGLWYCSPQQPRIVPFCCSEASQLDSSRVLLSSSPIASGWGTKHLDLIAKADCCRFSHIKLLVRPLGHDQRCVSENQLLQLDWILSVGFVKWLVHLGVYPHWKFF